MIGFDGKQECYRSDGRSGYSVHTFSLVACDLATGEAGIAVASKFLAVGAIVPWALPNVGVLALQANVDVAHGPRGLDLMRGGCSASEAIGLLLHEDVGGPGRQIAAVDSKGRAAAYTGEACSGWAGHRVGATYSCQGNLLAGDMVVSAMAREFERSEGDLSLRLLAGLSAADAAGGDRRGKQSAALLVVGKGRGYGGGDQRINLRVDDSPEPVAELIRLHQLHMLYFGTSPAIDRLQLQGVTLERLQRIMREVGTYSGAITGLMDRDTLDQLEHFVNAENFEMRVNFEDQTIDRPAYEHLVARFLA
jgi:uncharacterized Ntn-hydrolase superfamily protein